MAQTTKPFIGVNEATNIPVQSEKTFEDLSKMSMEDAIQELLAEADAVADELPAFRAYTKEEIYKSFTVKK